MSGTDTWQGSSGVQTLRTSPLDVTVYCQLQSKPAAAGGAGHCCRWWQEYVTKLVLCTVALSSALRRRIPPFRVGRDVREQLRWRQSSPLLCVSEMQSAFLLVLLHFFEEPRWDTGVDGHRTGLCSSESLQGRHVAEGMSQGVCLGHWLGPWHCPVLLPELISSIICMGET